MNLGTPVHVLAARPVVELQAYEQYTQEHGLPLWRIEMQLAQIAMLVDAQRLPGRDLLLRDYLIRPQPTAASPQAQPVEIAEPPTEAQAQAAADAIGFRPQIRRKPSQPKPSPAP